MSETIPQNVLERARRTGARRAAAMLIEAMADTDASFSTIAALLGQQEAVVRRWVHEMIEGGTGGAIEHMSDILATMAAEPILGTRPCRWGDAAESEPAPQQASAI